jgi:hypothetical protein
MKSEPLIPADGIDFNDFGLNQNFQNYRIFRIHAYRLAQRP